MANNYTQFSEIYEISAEQAEVMETIADTIGALDRDDDDPERIAALNTLDKFGVCVGALPESWEEFGELGFQFEIKGAESCELWVYAEENGDVDALASALSAMLEATGDDRILTGTWADWCSKLRAGEFSGGYWVVSAKHIDFGSTYSMAQQAKEKMLQAQTPI